MASLPFWTWRPRNAANDCEKQAIPDVAGDDPEKQVEDYPEGYPRFSALIAADDSFHISRRFSYLRARLLLWFQDRLSVLEEELEKIDGDESRPLFLRAARHDKNKARAAVFMDIKDLLASYDEVVERTHRTLSYDTAKSAQVSSLQNWIDGNGCIARDETKFLKRKHDLISIAPSPDTAVTRLEAWVEYSLVRCCGRLFPMTRQRSLSRDPHVFIFHRSFLRPLARAVIVWFSIALLLIPVIVCNFLPKIASKMIVICVSTTIFILTLSGLAEARTVEMFAAGAAYGAVLVVFASGVSMTSARSN